ncbi:MAG: nucleotide exchange factor GrpE [Candidatus Saccharicenans sp.]|jgi:molecular chaperone GrpE|nr:nucleotide exchange factor GrpE [Candidatus Saccharicenans sp.]MDH7492748.1 nucleotide exchange factor GrpE [Candidatus Saccharicenans sp.]
MSGKKNDKEKTENIKTQDQAEHLQEKSGIRVKEKESQPEPIFKVSEQEEIEYLEQEKEEKDQTCSAPPAQEPSPEELIQKLQAELEKKNRELEQLKQAVEELKEKFLRAAAELDNVRKRTERDKEEFFQYALSDLLRDTLPIIDNFERALKSAEAETNGQTFREGVELIYRMLLNLIRKYGVRPIELQDNKFDPSLHHALASEESAEVSEPQVMEELQKGYLIHNRLLRPTMVKVIIPKKN